MSNLRARLIRILSAPDSPPAPEGVHPNWLGAMWTMTPADIIAANIQPTASLFFPPADEPDWVEELIAAAARGAE